MANKTNAQTIAVLTDLTDSMEPTLQSAVALAGMLQGKLVLFHVRNPSQTIQVESQLSAVRNLNKQYIQVDNAISEFVKSNTKSYGIQMSYSIATGNPKNGIQEFLEANAPNYIVLGKKKNKPINLFGKGITNFVLNEYKGTVLIADDKNPLQPGAPIQLGFLGNEKLKNNMLANTLMANAQGTPKIFKMAKEEIEKQETASYNGRETIDFVFDPNDMSAKMLAKYIKMNAITLFCVQRTESKTQRIEPFRKMLKNTLGNLNVSMMLMGQG